MTDTQNHLTYTILFGSEQWAEIQPSQMSRFPRAIVTGARYRALNVGGEPFTNVRANVQLNASLPVPGSSRTVEVQGGADVIAYLSYVNALEDRNIQRLSRAGLDEWNGLVPVINIYSTQPTFQRFGEYGPRTAVVSALNIVLNSLGHFIFYVSDRFYKLR